MSKLITYVPLSAVERMELRVTNCRKTLAQVKAETKAHYVLNGGMWNPDGSACPLLKVDGVMRSGTPWRAMGYAWDRGPDIRMTSEYEGTANFIAVTPLILPGTGPVGAPSYGSAQGGRRGRSAIGLRGGDLALYCSGDGTGDAATPEALRDELAGLGWASAVMLDGGGSSQCDFGGERITASRKVHNWICVWLKQGGQEPPDKEESMGKYTVTPSIGVNIRSGPGTGYGKVGAYPVGTVVDVLEERDGWGRTDKGWVSLAYLEAVEAPQRVTDTGLAIQTYLIAQEADNRPGGSNPCKYITIHETGNAAKGADAAAHGAYLDSAAGEDDLVSYHYTVDDHAIVQHLPDTETAYHAGDGADGPGNTTSIGIEICVNQDGDFERAKANAASLVRLLMGEHGIPLDKVVQHNQWNGKDCPKTIRATPGGWEAFLDLCDGCDPEQTELEAAVDTLAAAGILTAVDYWKGDTYSSSNVHALIKSMAAYVRHL
ncbi:MAG: N-acetylmuramoyl-L-alanine amidase [Flavonifractor plautii]|nr:N-acetylmuramoyl-L-alanine amidase [Flavonifractor plautii]